MAKSKIMDYPHLRLVIRCLGEFHAYSFIIRAANPMSFEKLKRMEEHVFLQSADNSDGAETDDSDNNKLKNTGKELVDIVFKVLYISLILKDRRLLSKFEVFFLYFSMYRL